jgi:hypothetical protein
VPPTNPAGAHQFQSPISRIVAGTSSPRTIVASIRTARARPNPILLMITMSATMNAPKTTTMIAAAPVITVAVRSSPRATAAVAEPRSQRMSAR